MPILTQAQHMDVYGGSFTDVQGGVHTYHAGGDVFVQHGHPLFQLLLPATASGAAYNSRDRYPPPKCYPGTREAILHEIADWAEAGAFGEAGSVMWLHGPAGAGKSAVAQTICESSADRKQLAASFFFSRGDPHRNSINPVFTSIAFQMTVSAPELKAPISQVVQDNPLIVHEAATATQMERLIVAPIRSVLLDGAGQQHPFLIVVDGLDECTGNDNQSLLLKNLIDLVRVHSLPLHILVVSRPEPHIKHIFHSVDMEGPWKLSLYGNHHADQDIYHFLTQGFREIHEAERHSYIMESVQKPWPPKPILTTLVKKSGGYFIYASTVLQFVGEEYFSPVDRLREILDASLTAGTTAFAELDRLYAQILSTSRTPVLLKRVLGCILLPVSSTFPNRREISSMAVSMMEQCLGLRSGEVMLTLRSLHSLLSFDDRPETQYDLFNHRLPDRVETYISSLHASFQDFALNKDRAGVFYIDAQQHHIDMVLNDWRCLNGWANKRDNTLRSTVYLLSSLAFHFSKIHDKFEIGKYLRISELAQWEPLVSASEAWGVPEKHILVDTVETIRSQLQVSTLQLMLHTWLKFPKWLQAMVPPPQAALQEISTVCDTIYLTHLQPKSEVDSQFIQGSLTMWHTFFDSFLDVAQFLRLPQSVENKWEYIHCYLNTWGSQGGVVFRGNYRLRDKQSFLDFMSDASRCAELFVDSGAWNAHLTVCCMETLAGGNLVEPGYVYSKHYLYTHLSRTPPGEKRVMDYLKNIEDIDTFGFGKGRYDLGSHAQGVVKWLEHMGNPPNDLVLSWRALWEEFESARRVGQHLWR